MSVQIELNEIEAAMRNSAWDVARKKAAQLVKKNPQASSAYNAMGVVARRLNQFDEAIAHFRKALSLSKDALEQSVLNFNIAQSLFAVGDIQGSLPHYEIALTLNADNTAALCAMSNALRELGRVDTAIEKLESGLLKTPKQCDVLLSLGVCYQQKGEVQRARDWYQQLLSLEPEHAIGLYNLACLYNEAGELKQSQALLKQSLKSDPNYLDAVSMLLRVSQQMCDWATTEPLEQQSIKAVEDGHSIFPFAFLSLPATQAQHALCSKRWFERRYKKRVPLEKQLHAAHSRIRIGWLSSDFHDHPTARLLVEALELMNRQQFELYGYGGGPGDNSEMQHRIRACFEHFSDIRGVSDQEAAQHIRSDEIDILIDLGGYTANSRTGVMAYRPATVQAQYLGFPGSLQAPWVDYVITDQTVTPLDQLTLYTEKAAYLPHCYQCNDRQRKEFGPVSRAAEGLPQDAVVLASLNQSYKIRSDLFAAWCDILKRCDTAVLWLLAFNEEAVANLKVAAKNNGIPPDRLIFAKPAPNYYHQSRLALADVFLDTWLYNSHTTASDALWVKKPLVTLCGETFPSRVAASILKAAKLDLLVTDTVAQYIETVERLVKDSRFKRLIEKALNSNHLEWALFDTPKWTAALQNLFKQMNHNAQMKQAPALLFANTQPEESAMDTTLAPQSQTTQTTRKELLIGCGSNHAKKLCVNNRNQWEGLVTLDYNGDHNPDFVHDLTQLPLPFADNSFDEIHAYEVLEHTGAQGDYKFFFAQFTEFYRILKNGGVLLATCPSRNSPWAWGDPSHTRLVQPENLIFLDQSEYIKQVGITAMSDFRNIYSADFTPLFAKDDGSTFSFAIKAVKPTRHRRPTK
jgi:predicted O-linked N-acetylglucosamine transferase (SPINDLY family)